MAEVGGILRNLRRGAGLTQEELAERMGMTQQYVSQVERGARSPSWEYLLGFSHAVGANVIAILRAAGLIQSEAVALEQEIAAFIQQVPEFAGLFEFAREHPERLAEVVRYAHYLVSGETGQAQGRRGRQRRRTAAADS